MLKRIPMKRNLDIASMFCQFLGPSLYGVHQLVVNYFTVLFRLNVPVFNLKLAWCSWCLLTPTSLFELGNGFHSLFLQTYSFPIIPTQYLSKRNLLQNKQKREALLLQATQYCKGTVGKLHFFLFQVSKTVSIVTGIVE